MDRKITKERVNIHLEYDWIKYVVIIAVAVLMWWMIYSSANSIANQFKIDLMCVDTPTISDTMNGKINGDKKTIFGEETVIEQINFSNQYSGTTGGADFMQIFPLRSMTEDMLIAPKDWMADNPSLLSYLLDFKTIYDDYEYKDKNGNPILGTDGNPKIESGYWRDEAGQAMLGRLRDWDALYTYHFDREYWVDYYTEALKNNYPDEEKLAAAVEKTIDELVTNVIEKYNLEGQVLGIILNKVPGLENGCFFSYAEDTVGEGADEVKIKREYVLSIFRPNLDPSSGGGNKGHFNGAKMDQTRIETFEFIQYLFSYDAEAPTQLNAQRYAAL